MNSFDLKLAKFIQESAPVSLEDAAGRFDRTESTIKRSIRTINDYLSLADRIIVERKQIDTRFSYRSYMNLLGRLQFKDYLTIPEERISALTVALCLRDVVNKKSFYEQFNVSKTTLKNDRELIEQFLQPFDLALQAVPRQGSCMVGSEALLRVLASRIIMKVVEVAPDNQLVEHKSNPPMSRMIARDFLQDCHDDIQEAIATFDGLMERTGMLPSYNHKKFFLVYLAVAKRRVRNQHYLCMSEFAEFLLPPDFQIVEQYAENHFANLLFSAFTFSKPAVVAYDRALVTSVRTLCRELVIALDARIYNPEVFFEEVYTFAYSALVQSRFCFFFEDKKLNNVEHIHHDVYAVVRQHINKLSDAYQLPLSNAHLGILTLILKKLLLQNRQGRTRKKIYIVTNSAENKVGFFVETIKAQFNVEVLDIVNTNELHKIAGQDYDLIITFTNKISSYLDFYHLHSVKVNFNLQKSDFDLLREAGLSHVREKMTIEAFSEEIEGLSPAALKKLLAEKYGEYFI